MTSLVAVVAIAAHVFAVSSLLNEAVAASGQYNSTGSAQSIVDESCTGTPSGAAMTVNVPSGGTITDIDVGVRATHTYRGALTVFVTSPQGTTATLADGVGDGAVNMHARFNDEAGTVIGGSTHPSTASYDSTFNRRPETAGALSVFDGQDMAGNWTIRICDFDAYGDSGQLLSAHLHITYNATTPPAPSGSQQCASLTGAWSGSSATSGGITVTRTLGTSGGGTWGASSTDAMNTINAWSEAAVQGRSSLVDTFQWPGGPTSSSGNRGTYTVSFNKPVTNPVFHIDRVGGYSGSVSNSSKWILASSGTMYRLAGVDHFDTFADNSFIRTIGDTTANSESSFSTANGTAAGSVMISGTHSSVSFTVEGHSVGSGAASDQIEMVVCAPQADLSLNKVVDNAAPTVGQNVTFTLTLTNSGPEDAPNVQVTDLLPAGLTFVSATPSQGSYTSGTGVWDVGTVSNGASPTLQIVATVDSTGSITNAAEVTASGYADPDSTPGDGSGDDYASVGITASAPSVYNCPVGSTATGSGYATSGSGSFRDEVFWFDWNCGGATSFGPGSTVNKIWSLPNGTTVSASITGISHSISSYVSGTWGGDVFPSVYAGINPVGLINTTSGEDPAFTISFSAIHNGVPVSLDFVAADVEETASTESLSIATNAAAFELLEQFGGSSVSGAGTGSVTFNGTGAGGTALVSSYGSPTFNASLNAGGKQAFGFGVRLKRDFSDAPTTGYGGGSHRRIGDWLIGAGATTEQADYNDANAAGDVDDGVVLPAMVQGEAVTIPVTVSGSGGYLQAWVDWDGDSSFGGAGEQIALDVQDGGSGDNDGTANGTIELAVTVPPTAVTTQTFARFRWSTATGVASSGSANDGEVEDYAMTVAAAAPALTVTKTASPTGSPLSLNAGDTITYTVAVENTGNVTITGISVADVMDVKRGGTTSLYSKNTTLTCPATSLAPGASMTCTDYTHTATQFEINDGVTLENTATATGSSPGNTDDVTANDVHTAVLTPQAAYTPTVPAEACRVIDADFRVDGHLPPNSDSGHTTANWLTDMGYSVDGDGVPQITGTPTGIGEFDYDSASSGSLPIDSETTSGPNGNTAILSYRIEGAPGSATTTSVTDPGFTEWSQAFVKDPADGTLLASSAAKYDTPSVVALSYTMPASGYVELYVYVTDFNARAGWQIPDGCNPELSVTKTVKTVATTALGANPAITDAGDQITYQYVVTNSGTTQIGDAAPTDAGPTFNGAAATGTLGAFQLKTLTNTSGLSVGTINDPTATTLWVGDSATFEAVYTLTQADIDNVAAAPDPATAIDNTGFATGTPPANSTLPAVTGSSAETGLTTTSALTVTKSASDTADVTVGQVITYTYTITNTGNTTVSAIKLADAHGGSGTAPAPDPDTATLTDNLPTGDSDNPTTGDSQWDALAPGDVLTVTATYTVTQNDVDTLQ